MNQDSWTVFLSGAKWISGVSGLTVVIMKFFDFYAAGIGAIVSILTFFTWLYFQRRADKNISLSNKNESRIKEQDKKLEYLERQLKGLSDRKSLETKQG